ncbi:MAG: hypothetical protein M3Z04_19990 [Chloroflexota bacterium]|nr:hypothetical protein [Chloroflexota bacterium]
MRRVLPGALIGLIGALFAYQVVQADPTTGLGVRLVNGTPAGTPPAGVPLTVYQIDGTQQQIVARGQADSQGGFDWPDLRGPISARYVVSTTYQGAAYRTDPATLPAPAVTLRVYDATADDTTIRIANAGMVIVAVDAATQQIQVLETLTLHNSGPRTFVPSTTGSRGPMGLLRFGLPDGAGNLTPDGQLAAQTIIQVNTGFATDLPLPPGDTTVAYRYDLAYGALESGGYAALSKTLAYPVDRVRVLVPQAAFTVSSPQLAAADPAAVGSRTYRLFQGANLPAHSEVTLELRDLPLNQPLLRTGNAGLQALVGLLLVVAVGLPVGYRRWYQRQVAGA